MTNRPESVVKQHESIVVIFGDGHHVDEILAKVLITQTNIRKLIENNQK